MQVPRKKTGQTTRLPVRLTLVAAFLGTIFANVRATHAEPAAPPAAATPLQGQHRVPAGRTRRQPAGAVPPLAPHSFSFMQRRLDDPSQVLKLWEVTFPSPVVTPHPNNNTVHCEYFQPLAAGKHPGVIVLHILGGDFALSRLFCRSLAHHGVAALFVKMPYYGPGGSPTRRPAWSRSIPMRRCGA